jgi:hypothetical protein
MKLARSAACAFALEREGTGVSSEQRGCSEPHCFQRSGLENSVVRNRMYDTCVSKPLSGPKEAECFCPRVTAWLGGSNRAMPCTMCAQVRILPSTNTETRRCGRAVKAMHSNDLNNIFALFLAASCAPPHCASNAPKMGPFGAQTPSLERGEHAVPMPTRAECWAALLCSNR